MHEPAEHEQDRVGDPDHARGRRQHGDRDEQARSGRARRRALAHRLEADHPAGLALGHLAAIEQQVDVPEHLAERQVGLRHGDVAPQRLRDLVRGARPLARSARGSCARGARASRSARRSAPRGRRTGSPWPGSTSVERPSRASRAATRCRSAARAGGRRRARRLAAERARDQRVGGDVRDQVVAAEQRAALARRGRSCPTGEWPGRCSTSQRAAARARARSPSASGRVTVGASAPAAERARDRAQRGDDVARDAVAQHQRLGEARRRARPRRRSPRSRARAGRARTTSAPERRGEDRRPARGGRCAGG